MCTPEYAFGVPGTLKNALDLSVGTCEFVGKPVVLSPPLHKAKTGMSITASPSIANSRLRWN
ncbi:MAG TPA: NAD(P)H-dependent oxidoreductase [Cyclobacteriaceae bacterium]|nr:hypothetical protein [Cytophagales bacterium]HRF35595.1 NAD(P)H-dependent oxidoreductase [Cyclobacteriaceae bacterium]